MVQCEQFELSKVVFVVSWPSDDVSSKQGRAVFNHSSKQLQKLAEVCVAASVPVFAVDLSARVTRWSGEIGPVEFF
ncbi:hypothetical protein IQ26_05713 [Mesorhizobium tianshanense]|uniref:Uncharacterized protein n=1 Tax=Mesorhizobium tianshanense TaxID=39844 RepID=A0A562N3X2_9HYPH|nr:hypothetical protein IQ26_05713 [Mesorhizobium tianshanense]